MRARILVATCLSLAAVGASANTIIANNPLAGPQEIRSEVSGSQPAAIDTNAQASIGAGSWRTSAGAGQKNTTLLDTLLYQPGQAYTSTGLKGITLHDVTSLAYDTYRNTDLLSGDWYITLYTAPTGNSNLDGASWYGRRINLSPFEGAGVQNTDAPTGQWNTWSTDAQNLSILDTTGNNFNFAGEGTYDWNTFKSGFSSDFNPTLILMRLETGSAWASNVDSFKDNFQFGVDGGLTTVDFEPVPEPATMLALGAGLLALANRRRK